MSEVERAEHGHAHGLTIPTQISHSFPSELQPRQPALPVVRGGQLWRMDQGITRAARKAILLDRTVAVVAIVPPCRCAVYGITRT